MAKKFACSRLVIPGVMCSGGTGRSIFGGSCRNAGHQPKSDLPALDNNGTADVAAESPGAASGEAAYSIRDFVRATVERKWNLDFGKLGRRQYAIPLHIVMRRDGNIVGVEIVDHARYLSDAVYRSISLSARNAVLLSSPISLPPGEYRDVMEMTLVFNPRDMRR